MVKFVEPEVHRLDAGDRASVISCNVMSVYHSMLAGWLFCSHTIEDAGEGGEESNQDTWERGTGLALRLVESKHAGQMLRCVGALPVLVVVDVEIVKRGDGSDNDNGEEQRDLIRKPTWSPTLWPYRLSRPKLILRPADHEMTLGRALEKQRPRGIASALLRSYSSCVSIVLLSVGGVSTNAPLSTRRGEDAGLGEKLSIRAAVFSLKFQPCAQTQR